MGARVHFAVAAGLALAACAGRDPHPVSVVQPPDTQSDRAMIRAEIEANNVQAQKLAEENSREDRAERGRRRRWRRRLAGLVRHGCKRRRGYGDGCRQGAAAIPSDTCRAAMSWWVRAADTSGLRAAGALILLQHARPPADGSSMSRGRRVGAKLSTGSIQCLFEGIKIPFISANAVVQLNRCILIG
jgi:hypothetical protein